jgi:hypothetical protein
MTSLPQDIPSVSINKPAPALNQNAIVSLVAGLVTWLIGWLGSCSLSALLVVHPLYSATSWCPSLIGLVSTVVGRVGAAVFITDALTAPQ